jgi:hypothetical protein
MGEGLAQQRRVAEAVAEPLAQGVEVGPAGQGYFTLS